jgi:hypothetical protein
MTRSSYTPWLKLTAGEQERLLGLVKKLGHKIGPAGFTLVQATLVRAMELLPSISSTFAVMEDFQSYVVLRWRVQDYILKLKLQESSIMLEIIGGFDTAVSLQMLPANRVLEPIRFSGTFENVCTMVQSVTNAYVSFVPETDFVLAEDVTKGK